MGQIGYGYGSEWHLLRYLGYHRQRLQDKILSKIGGDRIKWLDFKFSNRNEPLRQDSELKGFEFLDERVQELWRSYWPQRGNVPNWDAVGQLLTEGKPEWLLVEAKAHVEEIRNGCGATSPVSIQKIRNALSHAMKTYSVEEVYLEKWFSTYYQFCNRLTMLHFLAEECDPPVPAHLVMIYFYGDQVPDQECPQSPEKWKPVLKKQYQEIGLVTQSELLNKIHTVYLPVS